MTVSLLFFSTPYPLHLFSSRPSSLTWQGSGNLPLQSLRLQLDSGLALRIIMQYLFLRGSATQLVSIVITTMLMQRGTLIFSIQILLFSYLFSHLAISILIVSLEDDVLQQHVLHEVRRYGCVAPDEAEQVTFAVRAS